MIKPLQPGFARGKTIQPPCGRGKCTPSAAFGGTSPRESVSLGSQVALLPYEPSSLATPEGEVCSPLSLISHKHLNAYSRYNFPHRGKWCEAPKGVHFHRAKRGCTVFAAKGSTAADRRHIILIAHRAIPQPSAPRAVKLKNPPAAGPVKPENLFITQISSLSYISFSIQYQRRNYHEFPTGRKVCENP